MSYKTFGTLYKYHRIDIIQYSINRYTRYRTENISILVLLTNGIALYRGGDSRKNTYPFKRISANV